MRTREQHFETTSIVKIMRAKFEFLVVGHTIPNGPCKRYPCSHPIIGEMRYPVKDKLLIDLVVDLFLARCQSIVDLVADFVVDPVIDPPRRLIMIEITVASLSIMINNC